MTNQYTRPALPASLRQKRTRNILVRVISCILLLAALIVVMTVWGEQVFPFPRPTARYVTYAILALVPFAITGVPYKLIDCAFSGTVLAVNVKEGTGSYRMGSKIWPYLKHDLVLTVQTDHGETKKYTALSVGVKRHPADIVPNAGEMEYHADTFSIGDHVHKYYGFKHLYVEPKTEVDQMYCVVCGAKNEKGNTKCWSCHSELISFEN